MSKPPSLHLTVRGWLLNVPVAEQVPAYVARLTGGRYAFNTIIVRGLRAIAHLAHWMAQCRLPADDQHGLGQRQHPRPTQRFEHGHEQLRDEQRGGRIQ